MCGCSILKMTVVFMVNWRQTIQKFLKSYVLSLCQYFRRFIAVVANFSFSTSVIWSRNACYGTTAVTHTAVCFFPCLFLIWSFVWCWKAPTQGHCEAKGTSAASSVREWAWGFHWRFKAVLWQRDRHCMPCWLEIQCKNLWLNPT